jgi:hypothetical protein
MGIAAFRALWIALPLGMGGCSAAPEAVPPRPTDASSDDVGAEANVAAPVQDAATRDVSTADEGGGATDASTSNATDSGNTGTSSGLRVSGACYPVCVFPDITDPNNTGWGWELQASCISPRNPLATGAPPCRAPSFPNPPPPGNGRYSGGTCYPFCTSRVTATSLDGGATDWGYERGRACIVAGTAVAVGGLPCDPNVAVYPPGNGVDLGMGCLALCQNPLVSAVDGGSYGYENGATCVVSSSAPALQGTPCTAPNAPPPPPPPPPPAGVGWNADYTATMFGQVDCAPRGVTDSTNLHNATCVVRTAVQLDATNQVYYGAPGDLSTLWTGNPCTCVGGQSGAGVCGSAPACNGQSDCAQCVEIACNGAGTYSFMNDGFTHDEFCKPNTSVVIQIIDACPHNHPNNVYWCTAARPNHIDLSCSAFAGITQGRPIAQIGSINAYVRPVSCSVGLGVKTY